MAGHDVVMRGKHVTQKLGSVGYGSQVKRVEAIRGCCGYIKSDGRPCRKVLGNLWNVGVIPRGAEKPAAWMFQWGGRQEGDEPKVVIVYVPRELARLPVQPPPVSLEGLCSEPGHGLRHGDPQEFLDAAAKPTARNQVGTVMMGDHPPSRPHQRLEWRPTIQ